jgi:triacylglycerol esterase/lipase EstA (alpha/beta hydrolase family)
MITGCSGPYSIKKHNITQTFKMRHRSALNSNQPSELTQQYLRLENLTDLYRNEPTEFFDRFYKQVLETQHPQTVRAMAELSFLEGRKQSSKNIDYAVALYVTAAEASYRYLLANDLLTAQAALDPTYRFVADIYNAAVAELVEFHEVNKEPWETQDTYAVGNTIYDLTLAEPSDEVWDPDLFDQLISAYEVQTKGLRNHYYTTGLGAALIGIVNEDSKIHWGEFFADQKAGYPVTAMLTFEPARMKDSRRHVKAQVVFYNTLTQNKITLNNTQFPLDVDYSTPLVIQLEHIDPFSIGLSSMLDSDKKIDSAGLFLLEPYNPDKIPVVMVHGLMSSPATWMNMLNDLRGQPEIRDRFQFWFFSYPTGLPVLYSSSILRQQLLDIQQQLDPERTNPHFNNMVLLGHSMGGLLSRVMTQDSGDAYWNHAFSEPIDQMPIDESSRELLEQCMFFESIPFVQRVIFVATPHRGSPLADRWYTGIASGMIELPGNVVNTTMSVFSNENIELNEQVSQNTKKVTNSIGNLSATSPFAIVYNQIPVRNDVTYHSIIGTHKDDTGPGSSDGVVPYESSHIDFAVSERLVHSQHGAHQHPDAIDEVYQILLQHLKETEKRDQP